MTDIQLPPQKRVGHLTLLREPRSITPRQFNALAFAERLDLVLAARGRGKHQLLVEAADSGRLIRALPAQELFLLLKEVGLEEAPELVQQASARQFTTFLDLDAWRDDRLDAARSAPWWQTLLEGEEEQVLEVARQIDFELLVLSMQGFFRVISGPEVFADEDARQEAVQRDGGYELDFHDAEQAKFVGGFLALLLRREPELFRHLLEAVRWEQGAVLEEEVFRLHGQRLQEQGFCDFREAQSVYAFLDPDAFDPAAHAKLPVLEGPEEGEAPGFVLAGGGAGGLLAEALQRGISSSVAWEFTYLVNKVLSADRIDPGDPDQVHASLEETFLLLGLGLEQLAGPDPDRAAALLEEVYLEHLFRLGFSRTLQLQRRAADLAGSVVGPYLEGPFRALVQALGRPHPRFFQGLEQPERAGERPFANAREISLAASWLERAEVQRRLFAERLPFTLPPPGDLDLSGCQPDQGEDLALSDFFLTALANRVMGRPFLPEPLPATELPALHARVAREGKVDSDLRRQTVGWLEDLEPGAGAFGEWCLDLWEEEFCRQRPERLDPRYLGGLIVRTAG